MAIRDIVTSGFGNGVFAGSIAKVVTRGFDIRIVTTTRLFRGGAFMTASGSGAAFGVHGGHTAIGLPQGGAIG